jgi:predicted NUDIX family phosphoesterase
MLEVLLRSPSSTRQGTRVKTVVEASADVLRAVGTPLHAREIAQAILSAGSARLSGLTPWKTVTSRLSMDIRKFGEISQFQRVGHARFGLRQWDRDVEFLVNRRRIKPIDETIKVVPKAKFRSLLKRRRPGRLVGQDIETLIAASVPMKRALAEETAEFVQLIPTFIVRSGSRLLTYRRTKRLPEARLHNARCVSFGGHMQVDDIPDLFARSYSDPKGAMFRELYEELSFSEHVTPIYLGVLYLTSSLFEKQHAGIVFDVNVEESNIVKSLETTRHADVQYMDLIELARVAKELDSWSRVLLGVLNDRR